MSNSELCLRCNYAYATGMDELKKLCPSKIFIHGTITARGFYEFMGFEFIRREIAKIRGVGIEVDYMEMKL